MVTVLVVGAGRFGRNYLSVLTALQQQKLPELPHIHTVVLSRTRLAAAQAMAAEMAAQPDCPFERVVGVQVRDLMQLEAVLAQYAPHLTCIVARDREIGDDIHAQYAGPALDAGAVLCEKPFSHALGDGAGLKKLQTLLAHPHADRFGLELPLAVMNRAMADDHRLGALLRNARHIRFVWEKQANGGTDLVDDLILHPWSLIPVDWKIMIKRAATTETGIVAELHLTRPAPSGHPDPQAGTPNRSIPETSVVDCDLRLSVGGVFRGMCIDDHAFQFVFDQGQLQLWEFAVPWKDVVGGRAGQTHRRKALAVDNPLARHISASLLGRPIVDAQRTFQSQQFMEAVVRALL